ncbi:MAG: helix-turn-helix domain-containing protein [Ruminococcaceae bacterium]|nr:helix-turn-helix domain-containing protein [Oscillospiraceae bacterium]
MRKMSIIKKNADQFDLENKFYINIVDLKKPEEEHTHNFVEIVYTLDGKGIHTVDGKEYRVKGGDVLVINYHRKHAVLPVDNLRYADIMLKPEYLSDALRGTDDIFLLLRMSEFLDISSLIIKDNLLLHFEGGDRKKIEFLIEWAQEEQKNEVPASGMILHSAVSMILSLVFRKMTEDPTSKLTVNEYLLDYVERNCSNRLLIHEIAAKCGYTAEHFSRIFKKYTGKAPVSYIMECRINKAKKLLLTTDLSVETIVFECGFTNRTAFFKKFFELVGVTPSQFRKNQK